jgi:hypothetical protein
MEINPGLLATQVPPGVPLETNCNVLPKHTGQPCEPWVLPGAVITPAVGAAFTVMVNVQLPVQPPWVTE